MTRHRPLSVILVILVILALSASFLACTTGGHEEEPLAEPVDDKAARDAGPTTASPEAGPDVEDGGHEGMRPGHPEANDDAGNPPDRIEDREALAAVLAEIRAGVRYHKPTPQDAEGRGIYPKAGEQDGRSERVMPPFIMGPRRQTDSMVRRLYSLLPLSVQHAVAFVIPDRVAQDPDAYLPYLRSRTSLVVVGNFVGIGKATVNQDWFVQRHDTELWMANVTLRLAQALGLKVHSVRYTMGDSISSYASSVRARLEQRLHAQLEALELSDRKGPVTWGADEAVPVALAASLPPRTIRVRYASEGARHHYDGNKTSREVVVPKLSELGLTEVDGPADLELFVLTNVTGDDGTLPNAATQRQHDQKTFAAIRSLGAEARKNLVIVDGRMFNGSLNAYAAPNYCDYLAYGAWGTFANKLGTTLASAKIVRESGSLSAARTLLLEAVAHDVYANGYRDGRDLFKSELSARGVTFDHFAGYATVKEVDTVFDVLNAFVDKKLRAHFAGSGCMADGERVRLTPQLWRTFESEAHLLPQPTDSPSVVGVFRTDLPAARFDPRADDGVLRSLTLDDIVQK